jgi:hypothetical protein
MPTVLLNSYLEDGIFMAGGVRLLRSERPEADIVAYVRPRVPNPSRIIYRAVTDTTPAMCYVGDSLIGFCFVDGISNLAHATNIMDGYAGINLPLVNGPTSNAFFISSARFVWERMLQLGNPPPIVYGGGWSWGGASLYLLPLVKRSDELPLLTYRLHTFGMPRPGSERQCQAVDPLVDHCRWMNDDDPIPLVPPRVSDFPAILPAFGIIPAIRASEFVQPRHGINLRSNGVWTPAELPTAAQPNFVPSLIRWWLAWNEGDRLPHAISEYIGRLNAALLLATPREHIVFGRREPADVPGAREVNQREREFLAQIRAMEHNQNIQRFAIPPRMRFKAQRVGRVWYTVFNETIIATPGTKRSAKRLARQGNAFLDSLQTLAVVDPDAFNQALHDYLKAAADAGSGFSPLLQTVQPT